MNPLVSLLVPTFNRADLLVPCLDSALSQTMADLEVVVVDGASTDGTWDVCLRYAAADARIRVFRDPANTGPVRGWWRCVEEARGTLATFLWSDDMLQPDFLTRTVAVLSQPDIGFVFTAVEIGPHPGAGTINYAHPSRLMTSEEFIKGSLSGTGGFPVSPACALFRLNDIRQSFMTELPTQPTIDMTTTGAGTDVLLYLLTARRYPFVACVSEPLAFFRAHPGSITVHGHGGAVTLGYALAKGWFARISGNQRLASRILAQQWLREMRTARRFMSPASAARRYGNVIGAAALVAAAPGSLGARVWRTATAQLRRHGQSAEPL